MQIHKPRENGHGNDGGRCEGGKTENSGVEGVEIEDHGAEGVARDSPATASSSSLFPLPLIFSPQPVLFSLYSNYSFVLFYSCCYLTVV